MDCPQCGSGLEEGASLCPECGAPCAQARSGQSSRPPEEEIHVRLAQANLLRLRKQYGEATAKCVEVLRRYPNNASAHSVLGDIYREQSSWAEALGWYKLAAQLDPTSAADRRKIEEAESRLRSLVDEGVPDASLWRRVLSGARARPPLGLTLGLVIGGILVATLVFLSMGRDGTRAGMLEGPGTPRVVAPPKPAPTRAKVAPSTPRPPRPRALPAAAPAEAPEPVIYTPGREPAQVPPAPVVAPSRKQRRLLGSLRAAAAAEGLMVAVDSVTIEPRDGTATVLIMAQDVVASPDSRGLVLHKCLRIAELALAEDSTLPRMTLRCATPVLGEDGVQREQLVFVGDLSRSTFREAQGRDLTFDEALALFTSPSWWHDDMLPGPEAR